VQKLKLFRQDCYSSVLRYDAAMESKTKRQWFRFHLLTAVLMMLAAGALLLFNLQPPKILGAVEIQGA
jgi:hypothetical protein